MSKTFPKIEVYLYQIDPDKLTSKNSHTLKLIHSSNFLTYGNRKEAKTFTLQLVGQDAADLDNVSKLDTQLFFSRNHNKYNIEKEEPKVFHTNAANYLTHILYSIYQFLYEDPNQNDYDLFILDHVYNHLSFKDPNTICKLNYIQMLYKIFAPHLLQGKKVILLEEPNALEYLGENVKLLNIWDDPEKNQNEIKTAVTKANALMETCYGQIESLFYEREKEKISATTNSDSKP